MPEPFCQKKTQNSPKIHTKEKMMTMMVKKSKGLVGPLALQ
jgi:hypothetical protein